MSQWSVVGFVISFLVRVGLVTSSSSICFGGFPWSFHKRYRLGLYSVTKNCDFGARLFAVLKSMYGFIQALCRYFKTRWTLTVGDSVLSKVVDFHNVRHIWFYLTD